MMWQRKVERFSRIRKVDNIYENMECMHWDDFDCSSQFVIMILLKDHFDLKESDILWLDCVI